MINYLARQKGGQRLCLIGITLLLQGCFALNISPDKTSRGFIGSSIDTAIESIEVINGHLEKERNRRASSHSKKTQEFIKNRYQHMTNDVVELNDGSFLFDVTNMIRTGCVTRYYADKNRVITSYEFLNPEGCHWD